MKGSVEEEIKRWLDRVVVGLNLCPFAGPVLRDGGLRIAVGAGERPEEAVAFALAEAARLLEAVEPAVRTTLVVLPRGLEDFGVFLDVVATVEAALEEAGALGVLQVATFHPDYVFAGVDPEDVSHFTNRAPCPIVHLLAEDDVEEAVRGHKDAEGIPSRNMETLRALGRDAVVALMNASNVEG